MASRRRNNCQHCLAQIHLQTEGNGMFFGFGSNQDYGDSTQVIAFANAGGLGLPDRDYYTKSDPKSVELRQKYLLHVQRMLELLGDPPDAAQREAAGMMAMETALAKASLTRVERREPHNLYHKVDLTQLQALSPGFDWSCVPQGELDLVNQIRSTLPNRRSTRNWTTSFRPPVSMTSRTTCAGTQFTVCRRFSVASLRQRGLRFLRQDAARSAATARLAGSVALGWSIGNSAKLSARSSSAGRLVRR